MTMLESPTVYFDVDDTLVLWDNKYVDVDAGGIPTNTKTFFNNGRSFRLVPHDLHIKRLKELKNEGYKIVVWSHRGANWAEEVVRVLQLGNWVDATLSKPTMIYDDIPSTEYMPERKYIQFKG